MDEHFSIRPASSVDRASLTDLKYKYTQLLYKGYLPDSYLNKLDSEYAGNAVNTWLGNQGCRIGVLEIGHNLEGYVVWRPDAELSGWGEIVDVGATSNVTSEQKEKLTHWAIKGMAEQGLGQVHIWLLQDNLRGRFMFESFGFKAQREMKHITRADYAFAVRRYTCQIKREKDR